MADHRDDQLPSTSRWSASARRLRGGVEGRLRERLFFIPILVLVPAVVAAALVLSNSSRPDELLAVAADPRPDTSTSAAEPPATLAAPPLPPPPTTAPSTPPLRIALVGDSLLNSAGPDFTREAMERDVRALLDAVAEARCIKWVTVQEDYYMPDTEAWSQGPLTLNVTLFREAALRQNLEVIDFAPIINDEPEWHVMDILHLDERGNKALADTISQSLECTPSLEDASP